MLSWRKEETGSSKRYSAEEVEKQEGKGGREPRLG